MQLSQTYSQCRSSRGQNQTKDCSKTFKSSRKIVMLPLKPTNTPIKISTNICRMKKWKKKYSHSGRVIQMIMRASWNLIVPFFSCDGRQTVRDIHNLAGYFTERFNFLGFVVLLIDYFMKTTLVEQLETAILLPSIPFRFLFYKKSKNFSNSSSSTKKSMHLWPFRTPSVEAKGSAINSSQ